MTPPMCSIPNSAKKSDKHATSLEIPGYLYDFWLEYKGLTGMSFTYFVTQKLIELRDQHMADLARSNEIERERRELQNTRHRY